jgi:hypothetical protein
MLITSTHLGYIQASNRTPPRMSLQHMPLQMILPRKELSYPRKASIFTAPHRTKKCNSGSMHITDVSIQMSLRAKTSHTLRTFFWSCVVANVTPGWIVRLDFKRKGGGELFGLLVFFL